MSRRSAADFLALLLDEGSFESWDQPIDLEVHDQPYRGELEDARSRAGADESVISGRGRIGGQDVAVVVSEFGFLGGSIGTDAARRLVQAVVRATREGLPIVAAPASGGTRMQEGTKAFVEMVPIVRAVVAHKQSGLAYLVYLRHPTTGGALASWGSLGHATFAEPGALVGFLGPRVYAGLHGREFPTEVQTAEHLVEKGVIDKVVPVPELAALLRSILGLHTSVVVASTHPDGQSGQAPEPLPRGAAWQSVTTTRRPGRPGTRDLLAHAGDDTVLLSGTGSGGVGGGMILALTRLSGTACVVVGHDRGHLNGGAIGPDGLRVARRGIALARELALPLVTVIDTPGAELSPEAEENALAGEIARCLSDLAVLTVPSVALLMGQGCGGGALALLPAATVVAAQHAWLSPLPPEGASVIVHGDVEHAPTLTEAQGVASAVLFSNGIVDVVVPEHPAAHEDPTGFCRRLAAAAVAALAAQVALDRKVS